MKTNQFRTATQALLALAVLAAALAAASDANAAQATWCDSVGNVAEAAILGRRAGMPEADMLRAAQRVQHPDARAASIATIRGVYQTDDTRLTPTQMANLFRSACLSSETNVLTERTP